MTVYLIHSTLKSLPIWSTTPPGFNESFEQPAPSIFPYLIKSTKPVGAVVILPGGGYGGKADYEGFPVAEWLNRLGISAFVLDYRVAPYRHPYPLLDARRALQVVRSRSDEWGINPSRVGILGFSAGGHLASTTGTHFETYDLPAPDAIDALNFRPDWMILGYPVISGGEKRHQGSFESLLGSNPSDVMLELLSNELKVTPQTPPAFIWHTANDQVVPVENSLLFAASLSAAKVPFELHIFPRGAHGLAMADESSVAEEAAYVRPWTDLCARWLKQLI